MNLADLKNPELQEKLKACTSAEELVALAKETGFELSDDQLEAVAGGYWECDHEGCGEQTCESLCYSNYRIM